MQHAGGEEDEDPGVDDGVDGDEAQGDQVHVVGLDGRSCVDVDSDLGSGKERMCVKLASKSHMAHKAIIQVSKQAGTAYW